MRKVLLIITGSVAAYKSLDLIRLLKKADYEVTPIVTKGASEFITPLLVSSISGNDVYSELFSLDDEAKMGHINLSRANDLVLVVPASADIIGKMAGAMADDLASTVLMATNKPVFIAPAMNDKMWLNKNTQANIAQLRENGVKILEPEVDILACGEYGVGKMISPDKIFEKVEYFFSEKKALKGKKVLLIDADPQANASSGLGIDVESVEHGTYQVLEHTASAKEAIVKTASPNVDIIPAHIDLVAIEIELVDKEKREYMMKEAITSLKQEYDYILIDCAPSLGLLTLNALTAADAVIIPIQCEYFALEGLGKLLNTIKSVQKIHNQTLDIEGLLLTMYDSRLRLSNQVVDEVKKHFDEMVFKTIIQRNVRLSEAPSYGESIISYDAGSKGANNYLSLAQELIEKNS